MAANPVLDYSSYYGAGGSDTALAIASDAAGNNYVAGSTTSSNFAVGGYDVTYSGGSFSGDAIVAKFGPDGKLYFAAGENGNSANAQSLNTTLGKLLRVNADGSIPEDNPF